MTDDEAGFVKAASDLEKIMNDAGLKFLFDLIHDGFLTSKPFLDAPGRPGWTMGEMFAYASGQRDAAMEILGYPKDAFERAKEIIVSNQADPLGSDQDDKPVYQ